MLLESPSLPGGRRHSRPRLASLPICLSLAALAAAASHPEPRVRTALPKAAASTAPEAPFFLDDPNRWSRPFHPQGPGGTVWDLSVRGDSLLVSGWFSLIDETPAWGMGLWDGAAWKPFGIKPRVRPEFFGRHVWEGRTAWFNGYTVEYGLSGVHRWNGAAWDLSGADQGSQTLLGTWQGRVVTAVNGPAFTTRIQEPDGSGILGTQLEGRVDAMAVRDGELWIGGDFKVTMDTSVRNLAVLRNGAWQRAGPEPVEPVVELIGHKDGLFVVSRPAISELSRIIRKSEGPGWIRVPVEESLGLPVTLAGDGESLYLIAGERLFHAPLFASKQSGLRISRWNGARFQLEERAEFLGGVTCAQPYRGGLVIGGEFAGVGASRAQNLAHWDGRSWQGFTAGPRPPGVGTRHRLGYPRSVLLSLGKNLVVGHSGLFQAGDVSGQGLAVWTGDAWEVPGAGLASVPRLDSAGRWSDWGPMEVHSLAADGKGGFYVSGRFDSAGGLPARNIAHWDGKAWHALGAGFPDAISLLADGDALYALWLDSVAAWNGTAWRPLEGLQPFLPFGMQMLSGRLWVCGREGNLATWDGSGWRMVPAPATEITVSSMVAHAGALHLATLVPGSIYTFDGTAWDSLPMGGSVENMFSGGDRLFVSGEFDLPDRPKTRLAAWDGKSWHPMVGGTYGPSAGSMAVHGEYLYLVNARATAYNEYPGDILRWRLGAGTGIRVERMIGAGKRPPAGWVMGGRDLLGRWPKGLGPSRETEK